MRIRDEVILAAQDYRYLLNRGYNQKVSLDLVVSRYLLSREERALLLRCIHRSEDAELVRSKVVNSVYGDDLVIDGYNVILTIVSALEGRDLYLCDDGIVRDLRSSYIKDFSTPLVTQALRLIKNELMRLRPKSVTFVLDKNVSWSMRHAEVISNEIPEVNVKLAKKADIAVLATKAVVASSDFVILLKAFKIYDLAGKVVMKVAKDKVVNMREIITRKIK